MSGAYAPWAIPAMFGGGDRASAAPNIDLRKQRVIIGTPSRGREVGDNYRLAVDAMREHLRDQVLPLGSIPAFRDGEQMSLMAAELARDCRRAPTGVLAAPHDLARTRGRMIRAFIEETTAEWFLFWDDDVWCKEPHVVLQNMMTVALATDVHVVGTMYPAKRYDEEAIVDKVLRDVIDALRAMGSSAICELVDLHNGVEAVPGALKARLAEHVDPHPLKHGFTLGDMRFWRRPDYNPPPPHEWFLPCNGVGFGFFLISRIAAIALTERFRAELSFPDHNLGGKTVDLCHQINDSFDSYSEDYSFCIRAAAGGFPVHAYVGPGAPMIHDGTTSFEAARETMWTTKA